MLESKLSYKVTPILPLSFLFRIRQVGRRAAVDVGVVELALGVEDFGRLDVEVRTADRLSAEVQVLIWATFRSYEAPK